MNYIQSGSCVLNLLPLKFPDCQTLWSCSCSVRGQCLSNQPSPSDLAFWICASWCFSENTHTQLSPRWTVHVNNSAIMGSFSKKYLCIPSKPTNNTTDKTYKYITDWLFLGDMCTVAVHLCLESGVNARKVYETLFGQPLLMLFTSI